MGYLYMGVEYNQEKNHIKILVISRHSEITSSDCEKIHNNLLYVLNVENYIIDKQYNIEVSSLGSNTLSLHSNLEEKKKLA